MSTQSQWGLAAATPGLVALQEARGTEVVGALPVWEPPRKTSKNGIVHHRFTKTGYKNGIIWLLPHNPAMKHSTPTESQIETFVQFYCSRNLSHPLVSLSLSLSGFLHYQGAGTTPLSRVIHTHCTSSWQIHGSPRETLNFAGWTWVLNLKQTFSITSFTQNSMHSRISDPKIGGELGHIVLLPESRFKGQ